MSESPIKSQFKMSEKNSRRFFGVLRHLAEFDIPLIHKMNVTVYKEDITEEREHILIAPSIVIKYPEHPKSFNSTENKIENIIEDSIIKSEISNSSNAELMNYRDSSDFNDEEE